MSATLRSRAARPAPPARRSPAQNLVRFVRTPKGTVLWVLLALVAVGMVHTQRHTLPDVVAAVLGALAVDLVASLLRQGRWPFPSGSIVTALLVTMVLARTTPAYAVALTAALAVTGKHAVRTRWSNVFNPATLGLLVGDILFRSGQSWWGALPYDGLLGFVLVLAAAWFIASKVNKLPLALSFLSVSLLVLTAASFFGASAQVAQVFRAPDINALVFFAGLMLTDPPTSPARHGDQVWFGALAGLIAGVIFLLLGVQWFILAGLPLANLAESLRRLAARPRNAARSASARTAAAGSPARPAAPAAASPGRAATSATSATSAAGRPARPATSAAASPTRPATSAADGPTRPATSSGAGSRSQSRARRA